MSVKKALIQVMIRVGVTSALAVSIAAVDVWLGIPLWVTIIISSILGFVISRMWPIR